MPVLMDQFFLLIANPWTVLRLDQRDINNPWDDSTSANLIIVPDENILQRDLKQANIRGGLGDGVPFDANRCLQAIRRS